MQVLQEYCDSDKPFEPYPNFSVQYPFQRALPDSLDKGIAAGKFDFGILRYNWLSDGFTVGLVGDVFANRSVLDGAVADRSALISLFDNRFQKRGELEAHLLDNLSQIKKPGGTGGLSRN